MSENLLKKISIKHVCGNFDAPAPGEVVELCVVMGYAKDYEMKATSFGESVGFHGDFKAINVATGETFRSSTCYLPDVAGDLLKNALDTNKGTVEFGFRVTVVGVKGRKEGEANKYEYRCQPLMDSAENDPLALLQEKLAKKLLAKAEPTPAAKKGGK